MRIVFPEKFYTTYDTFCPFVFDYPVYATITSDEKANAEPCWINIEMKKLNATIHLSYKKVDNNLFSYTEDSRTFAIKHQQKASAIDEEVIVNSNGKVYGLIYDIKGNTASSLQFYLTDSTQHFVRCALYFNSKPNADSLAPVIEFIEKDIEKMIETFRWK